MVHPDVIQQRMYMIVEQNNPLRTILMNQIKSKNQDCIIQKEYFIIGWVLWTYGTCLFIIWRVF